MCRGEEEEEEEEEEEKEKEKEKEKEEEEEFLGNPWGTLGVTKAKKNSNFFLQKFFLFSKLEIIFFKNLFFLIHGFPPGTTASTRYKYSPIGLKKYSFNSWIFSP